MHDGGRSHKNYGEPMHDALAVYRDYPLLELRAPIGDEATASTFDYL